jgi:hypothetical protein
MLMSPVGFSSSTGQAQKIINGRAVTSDAGGNSSWGNTGNGQKQPYQRYFPGVNAHWPKHRWRLLWTWATSLVKKRAAQNPPWVWEEEWIGSNNGGVHHLPGMYRRDYGDHFYTRQTVPVTEILSRNIYFWTLRPANPLARAWENLSYTLWKRWSMYTNFSKQDFRAVAPQRYDTPEHLSPTDIHQVYWRRLVLQARGMMRPDEAEAVPTTDAEKLSVELSPKGKAGSSQKQRL